MKENKRLLNGFTIAEILISMIVISVIIAASASLITVGRLALGSSKDVQACVVKDGGNITSANCVKAILSCKYNLGKAYQSLLFFANGNTSTSADSAKTVLKETCRQGGSKACDYFIEQCVADSTKCDVSGSTNDLRYFLDLSSSDSSAGKTYIYSKVSKWYKDGITNIINEVNNACEANGAGIACTIYLKQKVYNFDRSERADFNEQDPINGTVFDNGIVKLLMPSGTLCWGYNVYGQLGNNSTVNSTTAVRTVGGNNFDSISVGAYNNCALEKNTHNAYCWGYNSSGQLGNGTTTNSKIPVPVKSVSGDYCKFNSISAASGCSPATGTPYGNHTCGLDSSGYAWCWGDNASGQLGDGTTTNRVNPVKVSGHIFTSISAGGYQTCAIDTSGYAWCWGYNGNGQLGDGTTTNRVNPVKVVDADGNPYIFTSISTKSAYTCALDTAGKAWCWGDNVKGTLGNIINLYVFNPVEVVDSGGNPYSFKFLSKWVYNQQTPQIYGIDYSNSVWSWGVNPSKFTAANGYNLNFIESGYYSNASCALDPSGKAYCWGPNNFGQLGSGNNSSYGSPNAVVGNHTFSALSCYGTGSVLALDTSNQVWQWGGGPTQNNYPILVKDGSGNPLQFKTLSRGGYAALDLAGNPWSYTTKLAGSYVFDSITEGAGFSCALDSAGAAYCWGTNAFGQLGSNNTTPYATPHAVVGGHSFTFIDSNPGNSVTCGIEKDTQYAYCWGYSSVGLLGHGDSTTTSSVPVLVQDTYGNPYRFTFIAISGNKTCALDTSNHAWCWGYNDSGLGNGIPSDAKRPIPVAGSHSFTSISAGFYQVGAFDTSGLLWTWGLGDPSVVRLASGYNFSSISTGRVVYCALDSSTNYAWCWGYNAYGEVGNGTTSTIGTPVRLTANPPFSSISVGGWHTCGIVASGSASTPLSYWLSTTTANHITAINKIISVGITQSTDNANAYIKWLVSFDNWATCKTWDSTNSVWVAAANCSASSAANTSDDIVQGLHDYEFASGAGSLDFKAVLYNTDGVTIPDIDQVVVNYY